MADALDFVGWNHAIAAGMAVAIGAFSMTSYLRRRPALRHGLWLLVLVKLITPPIIAVPAAANTVADESEVVSETAHLPTSQKASSVWLASRGDSAEPATYPTNASSASCCVAAPSTTTTVATSSTVPTVAEAVSTDQRSSTWRRTMFAGVLLSLIVTTAIWVVGVHQLVRIQRLLKVTAGTSERLKLLSQNVAERFQLKSAVGVQTVDAPVAPMLWAWPGKATIVVPRELTETLDDGALRAIIAHEVAHLVRRDHWTNLFSLLVASIFWWNPLVWFVRRRLLAASEASCDALALDRLQGSRKTYAMTLLTVVDSLTASPPPRPALGMTFGSSHSITRRVELIADSRVRARTSRSGWIVLAAATFGSCLIPSQAAEPATPAPAALAPATPIRDSSRELATFCCPEAKATEAQKPTEPKSAPAAGAVPNSDLLQLDSPKLERLTRAYKTFSGVGYFVESASWNKRLHLDNAQADALLALDELVWDTREIGWKTGQATKSDRDAQEHLVLRHAEQMVKLGFFTPTQSAYVTQQQLSHPQFRRNALLFDPFFRRQLGVTLTDGQRQALIGKGVGTVEEQLLSEQQQLLLVELAAARTPPTEAPQLEVPTSDALAAVKLSPTFKKLKETEVALDLSDDQVRALRELERLARLGLLWIDRRGSSELVVRTREQFLDHADQIAMLGILTPEQRLSFRLMC